MHHSSRCSSVRATNVNVAKVTLECLAIACTLGGTCLRSPGSGLQDVRQPFQGHAILIVSKVKLLDIVLFLGKTYN